MPIIRKDNRPIAAGALRAALGALALLSAAWIAPVSPASAGDPDGAGDHPLIPRYAGSDIIGYDHRAFERFRLPLGPQQRDAEDNVVLAESMTVEGRHTRIIYAAPESRSTFEVFDNYRRALAEAGFETLFTCAGHACGERALLATHILYAPDRRLRTLGPLTEFAFSFPLQPYYLSARLPGVEGETGADDIYISIYVARENFDAFPETQNRALILLDVIEPAQLEDRIDPNGNIDADGSAGADIGATASTAESTPDPGGGSTIVPSAVAAETPVDAHDAAGMEAALREHGRVAIYAIHFASGSAELTQDSYPIVSEIASVLGRNPDLNLFVVGHSDIEGGYQLNMTLSQQRAEAIVRALVEREFIPADRLQAASVGMLVPVASNATEAGRALNRRVELVVR